MGLVNASEYVEPDEQEWDPGRFSGWEYPDLDSWLADSRRTRWTTFRTGEAAFFGAFGVARWFSRCYLEFGPGEAVRDAVTSGVLCARFRRKP